MVNGLLAAPIEARKLSMASWTSFVRESVIASGRDRSSQSWIARPKVRCWRRRGATYLLTQRPRQRAVGCDLLTYPLCELPQ